MKIDHYILFYLNLFGKSKIPSIRFWAMTYLLVNMGIEIEMKDGHVLTTEDCFIELDDCFSGDCYRSKETRHILLYLNQKRKYFGW